MSKLIWETEPNGSLRALGDNTGAEYLIEVGLDGSFVLFIDGYATTDFETADEAKADAEEHEARDEDPNNTFRGDFAGFAENH